MCLCYSTFSHTEKGPTLSEETLQLICVQFIKQHYPQYIISTSLSGIHINGPSKFSIIKKMKSQGWIKGLPDILVYIDNGQVLNIEFKTPTGTQSQEQRDIEAKLHLLGHNYFIVRSLDDLKVIFDTLTIKD